MKIDHNFFNENQNDRGTLKAKKRFSTLIFVILNISYFLQVLHQLELYNFKVWSSELENGHKIKSFLRFTNSSVGVENNSATRKT